MNLGTATVTNATGQSRQWIDRYECNTCSYQSLIPQRHRFHYPRDKRPLPGQMRAKCPGTVEVVRYVRAGVISTDKGAA